MTLWKYTLTERIDQIREALEKGARNADEVSEFLSKHYGPPLSAGTIRTYSHKHGFEFPKENPKEKPLTEAEKAEVIRQALKDGVNSIEGLFRAIDSSPRTLAIICRQHRVDLPENIVPYQTKPEIDKLVSEGLSLPEMKRGTIKTYQGVQYYLVVSGQYKTWKRAREKTLEDERKRKENSPKEV